MGSFGGWEILLIFLVVLLVFGAKRIPEIARGLGKGIREFKDATSNIKNELSVEDEHRIQSPRQGTNVSRQDPYQQQYQQQAPPQQSQPQAPQQQQAAAPQEPAQQRSEPAETAQSFEQDSLLDHSTRIGAPAWTDSAADRAKRSLTTSTLETSATCA